MRYRVCTGEGAFDVVVHRAESGSVAVWVDGEPIDLDVRAVPGGVHVLHDGESHVVRIGGAPERLSVAFDAHRAHLEVETPRRRARGTRGRAARKGGEVRSPMPGRVVRVAVAEGDVVEAGALLVVVEAMKMENEFRAEAAGVVAEVGVSEGQGIEAGALLVRLRGSEEG